MKMIEVTQRMSVRRENDTSSLAFVWLKCMYFGPEMLGQFKQTKGPLRHIKSLTQVFISLMKSMYVINFQIYLEIKRYLILLRGVDNDK